MPPAAHAPTASAIIAVEPVCGAVVLPPLFPPWLLSTSANAQTDRLRHNTITRTNAINYFIFSPFLKSFFGPRSTPAVAREYFWKGYHFPERKVIRACPYPREILIFHLPGEWGAKVKKPFYFWCNYSPPAFFCQYILYRIFHELQVLRKYRGSINTVRDGYVTTPQNIQLCFAGAFCFSTQKYSAVNNVLSSYYFWDWRSPVFLSKRLFRNTHGLNPVFQVFSHHGQWICRVIMIALQSKWDAGQVGLCLFYGSCWCYNSATPGGYRSWIW